MKMDAVSGESGVATCEVHHLRHIFDVARLTSCECQCTYSQLGYSSISIILDVYSHLFEWDRLDKEAAEIKRDIVSGGVTEWPNVPVLKTGDLARGPRVQISPPPPNFPV